MTTGNQPVPARIETDPSTIFRPIGVAATLFGETTLGRNYTKRALKKYKIQECKELFIVISELSIHLSLVRFIPLFLELGFCQNGFMEKLSKKCFRL